MLVVLVYQCVQWVAVVIRGPDPVLVPLRATVLQPVGAGVARCGQLGGRVDCAAVHFAFDGEAFFWPVKTDAELSTYRHWGCYWARVNWPERRIITIVHAAPSAACP